MFVGLDSFDWKVINPLLEKAYLPNIQKLISSGASSPIETLDPPFSPMLWTSIATGKTADLHGIHGFVEPNIEAGNVRPVSNSSRKCKALWNIFTHEGIKSNVIGWWPSNPVEPIDGIMVSNNFQKDKFDKSKWFLADDDVHPASLKEEFSNLRVHPSDIPAKWVLDFVPDAASIDQEKDKKLSSIVKFMAHSLSIRNAAIHAMKKDEWNFTAVYFDAPDHFSHGFMKYHPPQMPHISDEEYVLYKNVISACYIFHDVLLGELIQQAGEDADVMVLSDHGFHSDEQRPVSLPKFNGAPAIEHNPYGVFIAAGESFKKDVHPVGIDLLHLAPTLLHYFDLPIGQDMYRSPITDVFVTQSPIKEIVSWENVPGNFGELDNLNNAIGINDAEAIQQLEDLGYIERENGVSDTEKLNKTIRDSKYNLASVHAWKGEVDVSLSILEELRQEDASDLRVLLDVFQIYIQKGLLHSAEEVLNELKSIGDKKFARIRLMEAKLLRLLNKSNEAIALLNVEITERPKYVASYIELARIYKERRDFDSEKLYLDQALLVAPKNAQALLLKGILQFDLKKYEECIETLLDLLEIKPNQKLGHFYLGMALCQKDELEHALLAYESTLKLAPKFSKARMAYIDLLGKIGAPTPIIQAQKELLSNEDQEPIMVVTGLPRSGTSMTMSMVENAGFPVLTDHIRKADDNNPGGYFEFEAVKQLHKNHTWLDDAKGKVVKVVLPHIFKLPKKYRYKIIFIKRDIGDVLMSQETMKKRNNPNYKISYNFSLYKQFEEELMKLDHWVEKNSNIEMLTLDYDQVVSNPLVSAEKMKVFLESKASLDEIMKTIRTKENSILI